MPQPKGARCYIIPEYSDDVQHQLIGAEWRRMQRTEEETAALYRRLARQRIRAILVRLATATET